VEDETVKVEDSKKLSGQHRRKISEGVRKSWARRKNHELDRAKAEVMREIASIDKELVRLKALKAHLNSVLKGMNAYKR